MFPLSRGLNYAHNFKWLDQSGESKKSAGLVSSPSGK
jgi:hypothetical protein